MSLKAGPGSDPGKGRPPRSSTEVVVAGTITLEQTTGIAVCTLKSVLRGHGDEIVDLDRAATKSAPAPVLPGASPVR
jgi:hypothetical protein